MRRFPAHHPSTVYRVVYVILWTMFQWIFIKNIETSHEWHLGHHSFLQLIFSKLRIYMHQTWFSETGFLFNLFSVFVCFNGNHRVTNSHGWNACSELSQVCQCSYGLPLGFLSVFVWQAIFSLTFWTSNPFSGRQSDAIPFFRQWFQWFNVFSYRRTVIIRCRFSMLSLFKRSVRVFPFKSRWFTDSSWNM